MEWCLAMKLMQRCHPADLSQEVSKLLGMLWSHAVVLLWGNFTHVVLLSGRDQELLSCFPGQSFVNPELQCCFEPLHNLWCYSLLTSPGSPRRNMGGMGGISNPSRLCFPVRLFLAVYGSFITGSLRELRKINTHYVILSGRQGGNAGRGWGVKKKGRAADLGKLRSHVSLF